VAEQAEPARLAIAESAPVAVTVGRQFVSPRARRLAAEKQVDVRQVPGTGPQGRVEERDVVAFLDRQPRFSALARKVAAEAGITPSGAPHERVMRADVEQQIAQAAKPAQPVETAQPAKPASPPPATPVPPAALAASAQAAVTPMSAVRRVIAQRMSQSAQTAASVTLTTEIDATELVHLREQLKAHVEQQTGESLSYNVLLVKLVCAALHEFPYMNARISGDEIHTLPAANIGVAMDTSAA